MNYLIEINGEETRALGNVEYIDRNIDLSEEKEEEEGMVLLSYDMGQITIDVFIANKWHDGNYAARGRAYNNSLATLDLIQEKRFS